MKNLIVILSFLVFIPLASSAENSLSIEPLYGIERSQRLYPKPARFTTRTFLGIRGVYGTSLLAGELELSQSNSNETFPNDNEKVDYSIQRAMIGVRSYPLTSQYFGAFFRAGVRAQKSIRKVESPTGTEEQEDPLTIDPYAGTGVTVAFGRMFALSAGATLIYNRNAPSSEQYDTQYSFSFTIRAGNVY